jgi:hypothetical protein
VRWFEGQEYQPAGEIQLGSDADNVRVDAAAHRVVIGYGRGALAVIDPLTRSKVGDVALKAHPEGFQIDADTGQIFVNLPDSRSIAVVDQASQRQVGKWPISDYGANFPMALDSARRQILVIFRAPAELGVFSITEGKLVATAETCGDADDLFVDAKRGRVYVSCGAGFVDVLEAKDAYRRHASPPLQELAPRCSCQILTVLWSPSGRPAPSRQPFGCSDRCPELLRMPRTDACSRGPHFNCGKC